MAKREREKATKKLFLPKVIAGCVCVSVCIITGTPGDGVTFPCRQGQD